MSYYYTVYGLNFALIVATLVVLWFAAVNGTTWAKKYGLAFAGLIVGGELVTQIMHPPHAQAWFGPQVAQQVGDLYFNRVCLMFAFLIVAGFHVARAWRNVTDAKHLGAKLRVVPRREELVQHGFACVAQARSQKA